MKKNNLNNDGSVNSYHETRMSGHGYHILFSDTEFASQIEHNIFLPVFILNQKGITTHTSCQGHSKFSKIFKSAIRSNHGPQVTVCVLRNQVPKIVNHFSSVFVTTQLNSTIENTNSAVDYISIQTRFPQNKFFTNKFLCNQILKLCETLPCN